MASRFGKIGKWRKAGKKKKEKKRARQEGMIEGEFGYLGSPLERRAMGLFHKGPDKVPC